MRITIIGGGFSGCRLAMYLAGVSSEKKICINLIDSNEFGLGLAYSTPYDFHLMNVPVLKLSIYKDCPLDFHNYLVSKNIKHDLSSFVSRAHFGSYVRERFQSAIHNKYENIIFRTYKEKASSLRVSSTEAITELESGKQISSDYAVLATGYATNSTPPFIKGFETDSRIILNPFDTALLDSIHADDRVLLVGTGLTMLDTAHYLNARGVKQLTAISRKGILPQRYSGENTEYEGDFLNSFEVNKLTPDIKGIVSYLRKEAKTTDWRLVIDSFKQYVPELWRALSNREKKAFVRHLYSTWCNLRHRAPDTTYDHVMDMIRNKSLLIINGECKGLKEFNGKLIMRSNDFEENKKISFDRVVNCSGSGLSMSMFNESLYKGLLSEKRIRKDSLFDGLTINTSYSIIGDVENNERLKALGPWLKANFVEITSIAELNKHAEKLSTILLRGH